jgi:oxygen-independent coproporphyrinogen-3 oxidase
VLDAEEQTLGVYVHIPFCERVCPYCDFAVVGGAVSPELERRYVEAILAELSRRAEDFPGRRLRSVYLGGGTPALLASDSVARIVAAVRQCCDGVSAAVEVTLEANPSTLECARLSGFREAGVNRLSLGIQSFDDDVLRRLGRAHRAAEAVYAAQAARDAGFENLSLDLMFAAPGQSLAQVTADLDTAIDFAPEHVSSYELVVEPETPFALADSRGQLARATPDEAADMTLQVEARLERAGLRRYELTNYAKPGRESVHNRRYWERQPVLGVGLGAWSSDPPREAEPHGSRRRNTRTLADYLSRIEAGAPAADAVEVHDAATARGEAIFLGLRGTTGLSADRFRSWFDAVPRDFFAEAIERLSADGLLEESPAGDLRLTARGRLLSDLVSQNFV